MCLFDIVNRVFEIIFIGGIVYEIYSQYYCTCKRQ